jgi:hypothetical protein
MDLKETPSRVDTWLAASTRISDDAAAWLGKNLNPELQGEEASERAWVLLYDFLSVRYGIDKEQLIAQWIQLEGTRMGPGAAEALIGFLVREGFDQVLFARNSQMVDPDLI